MEKKYSKLPKPQFINLLTYLCNKYNGRCVKDSMYKDIKSYTTFNKNDMAIVASLLEKKNGYYNDGKNFTDDEKNTDAYKLTDSITYKCSRFTYFSY